MKGNTYPQELGHKTIGYQKRNTERPDKSNQGTDSPDTWEWGTKTRKLGTEELNHGATRTGVLIHQRLGHSTTKELKVPIYTRETSAKLNYFGTTIQSVWGCPKPPRWQMSGERNIRHVGFHHARLFVLMGDTPPAEVSEVGDGLHQREC